MTRTTRLFPAALMGLLGTAFTASADDNATTNYLVINPVVSIASYQDTPLGDVLLSADVITQQEIEASSATSFGELISQKTGIEVTRSGGPGAQTSIFLRGQASKNFVLLIDGVKAQTDTYGNLRPMDLPVNQIQKIEVLKGNASALYGDAAIGGVINVITKTGQLRDGGYVSVTTGSQNTKEAHAGLSQRLSGVDVSVSASTLDTDGLDATKASDFDKDGLERTSHAISLSKRVSARTNLSAMYKSSQTDGGLDGYYNRLETKNTDYTVSAEHKRGDLVDARLDISTGKLNYDSFGTTDSYSKGKQTAYKLVNISRLASESASHAITQGLERSDSEYNTTKRDGEAVFAGYLLRTGGHSLQANLRSDDITVQNLGSPAKTFSASSWLAGYGYQLTDTVKASLARSTGFRVPSAGEFSSNADLKAETHKSTEVSLQHLTETSLSRVTLFTTKTDNGIRSWPIENIEKIENQGMELTLDRQTDLVDYQFNLTLQDPKIENGSSGTKSLLKRAKTHASLLLSKQLGSYSMSSKLTYSGRRHDVSSTTMSSYTRLDANLSRALSPSTSVSLKADNLTDADYETTAGYNTAGRSLFLTLKHDLMTAY